MFFTILFISANALWCEKYTKQSIDSSQIYMLTESWVGGKCRVEDCSIPSNKVIYETNMIIESLSVLEDGKRMECCEYEGHT